ncbi:transketolase C-terminal domain-containing protein [Rhabdobacter roseus]|uniref:Transketolase n=1 Tax=Rhabdobacter roseus TaxID=1655419 RepID=A0A840TP78_9BACT|nr:transketolase C-terminal domain-containing protein [Rhabdobacter roseus]MBB5283362.1 transketolase [Rhabdobacter roseus]
MRKEFSATIEQLATQDESVLFITGDLGYSAFENLRDLLGDRFINAGVAEQNMVGVAAGLAYKGFKVFCYSIAPFVVYRCLEQFRNDVCFHNLPVFLVGNGGGYGYGIMGSSHHALEDLACLSSMQNVKAWVPGFSDEVEPVLQQIVAEARPAYLRLGAGRTCPPSSYQSGSFKVLHEAPGAGITVFALGPIANNVLLALSQNEALQAHVNVISALYFPLQLNDDILQLVQAAPQVLVAEEHVSIGGLAQQLSVQLLEKGVKISSFASLKAEGYPNGNYGSQAYHQRESGLDAEYLAQRLHYLLKTA